jgi:glycosyltransferase involved in cell wall biosynthesis
LNGEKSDIHILFINTDLPIFPGRGGVEFLHSTHLARRAARVGIVSQLHLHEEREKAPALRAAGVELFLWENPYLDAPLPPAAPRRRSFLRALVRGLGREVFFWAVLGLRRPRDTIIHDNQFRNIATAALTALNRPWQVLAVVQSNCSRYLDYLPAFPASVLVLHDIRALVYQRQALIEPNLLRKLAYQIEALRYRRFEGRYARKYDLVVTVSEADGDWVRRNYRPRRQLTLPLPVDPEYFSPLADCLEVPGRVVFTGMMNHPPNVDAAVFYATQVFPHIRALIPTAEFWVVGRDPAPAVLALDGLPGVKVTGFVPDIRPHMAAAALIVVPIRFGSGMRQKILEAWGMEKAIVSTTIGAEGIRYQDGENIRIADNAEEMVRAALDLLQNDAAREHLRRGGRATVLRDHAPAVLSQRYLAELETTLRENAARSPRRFVIDLRWMMPGVAGGIENLSRSLLTNLAGLETSAEFVVIAPDRVRFDMGVSHLKNFHVAPHDGPGRAAYYYSWRTKRAFFHRLLGDYWRSPAVEDLRQAAGYQAQVSLSIPGYIHPDFNTLSNVLIMPDIQHEYFPQFFTPGDLEERRRLYGPSIERAALVLAISEFTRQTLIEKLGTNPAKILVTPLAPDPIFLPGASGVAAEEAVLRKYDLENKPYFIFPGNTWRHKNHRTAVRALALHRAQTGEEMLLVCTGAAKEAQPELEALIRELGLENQVRFLGYVPREELPGLYQGAQALVFPSLFEGFGIPVLEAMTCGCPVICSSTTSLPEIAGDAALLCDPEAPAEFAAAISTVRRDAALRAGLIERGRVQAAKFSWERFAREVLGALELAHAMRYDPGLDSSAFAPSPVPTKAPAPLSRREKAQRLFNAAREHRRRGRSGRYLAGYLATLLMAPAVIFHADIYPAVSGRGLAAQLLQKLRGLAGRLRGRKPPAA